MKSTASCSDNIAELRAKIEAADAIVIGAGAGLSASAGFVYDGERFSQYFSDLKKNMDFTICTQAVFTPIRL